MTTQLDEQQFDVETRSLDDIVPYWRNPRIITDDVVESVASSIEKYGYQQPIVVDSEGVIIVGHTRYAALRRLGYTQAQVVVADSLTEAQVKQYRLIDNRAGEFSEWDPAKLAAELEGLDGTLVENLFGDKPGGDDPMGLGEEGEEAPEVPDSVMSFICPHCYHSWKAEVDLGDVEAGYLPAVGYEKDDEKADM